LAADQVASDRPSHAVATAIVAAVNADIAVVARLAREIWHRHYPGIISVAQIDYMLEQGYSHASLSRYLAERDAGLALAQREGQSIGFVAWCRTESGGQMKVEKVYVLPEHHGSGTGRALLEHVATQARAAGCSSLTLNVNRNNARAIRAYEGCGFAVCARSDVPIGNGFVLEDFVMVRELGGA